MGDASHLSSVASCSWWNGLWSAPLYGRAEGERRRENSGQSYSSGEWSVREGSEEEFIERWSTFIEWSSRSTPRGLVADEMTEVKEGAV
jgi:hypothetical protein